MKRALVLLAALFVAETAFADTCSKGLMPLFTGPQAAEICETFSAGTIGVLANNTFAVGRDAADSANINVWSVDTGDNTIINSSAGDQLKLRMEDDSNRELRFTASTDAALSMKFGDGGSTATQIFTISAGTSDADDDNSLVFAGGGATGGTRGASITLPGEEVAGGADITYDAGTGDTHIFQVAGTTEATISDDQLAFSGAAAEIVPGATSLTIKNNADAVDNLKITDAGQVTMAGASLGWSYVTGANTACTTTCTFAAVFGVDLAGGATAPVIVGPAAATADACVCAGAS